MNTNGKIIVDFSESGDYSVGIYPTTVATLHIHDSFAEALLNEGTLAAFKTEMEALIQKYYEPEFRLETTDSTQKEP